MTIASASVSLIPPYFMALPASLLRCRINSASSLFKLTTTPFLVMMAALNGMASNASTLYDHQSLNVEAPAPWAAISLATL